jgi:glycosyltransferase involved in cell wall biosynthesis
MPAYNEEAAIERVILEHVACLNRLRDAVPEWEIVCVDDGSVDRTPEILRGLQARAPQLRVIRQENQGIFGAVARAYREARGTHIYSTGSDGQWPAENLEPMMERLLSGAHLVIGVRTNRREVYTIPRRIVSLAYNLLPPLLFGVPVRDAGSVRLGVREVFQFELISRSPFFEAERIIRAHRAGFQVAFVPIRFLTRAGGKEKGASWKNIRTSLRDVLLCLRAYGLR